VFVGSGIFKSENPQKRAEMIVQAVTHYNDPKVLAKVSEDLGAPMTGIGMADGTKFSEREGGNMGGHKKDEDRWGWTPKGTSLVA